MGFNSTFKGLMCQNETHVQKCFKNISAYFGKIFSKMQSSKPVAVLPWILAQSGETEIMKFIQVRGQKLLVAYIHY
jgi:hypothetical protein